MKQLIVCDTSSLTRLYKTNTLQLLSQLYDEILIPPAVIAEFTAFARTGLSDMVYTVVAPQSRLRPNYGLGEREALAVAADHPGAVLLVEDKKAINAALRENIETMTTYDVFAIAKLLGLIDSTEVLMRKLIDCKEGVAKEAVADMIRRTGEPPYLI